MNSNHRADAVFREIAPAIFEAWLRTAPQHPDDQCFIGVGVSAAMMTFADRPLLVQLVKQLFCVVDADFTDSIDSAHPVMGIRATGLSWTGYQKMERAIEAIEAGAA